MVWEVEMFGYVDCLVIEYVCSMVIDSRVQLLGSEAYILLLAFSACYNIYQMI